jgi:hypothetical protein
MTRSDAAKDFDTRKIKRAGWEEQFPTELLGQMMDWRSPEMRLP